MPLASSGNSGGDAVAAAIAANPAGIAAGAAVTTAQLKTTWEAAITALYGNIVSNALVATTDTGVVTSGAGAGGTVTATGTGTVG